MYKLCIVALVLTPGALTTLYHRGFVHMQLTWWSCQSVAPSNGSVSMTRRLVGHGRSIGTHGSSWHCHLMNHRWRGNPSSLKSRRSHDRQSLLFFNRMALLAQLKLVDESSLQRSWRRLFLKGGKVGSVLTWATAWSHGRRDRS